MYVCICNAITDSEIRQAAAQGATDLQQLKDGLGVATCCGSCESCAVEILQQEASTRAGLRSQQHA
jgi:bacterioferritin-associated ferredoxin